MDIHTGHTIVRACGARWACSRIFPPAKRKAGRQAINFKWQIIGLIDAFGPQKWHRWLVQRRLPHLRDPIGVTGPLPVDSGARKFLICSRPSFETRRRFFGEARMCFVRVVRHIALNVYGCLLYFNELWSGEQYKSLSVRTHKHTHVQGYTTHARTRESCVRLGGQFCVSFAFVDAIRWRVFMAFFGTARSTEHKFWGIFIARRLNKANLY